MAILTNHRTLSLVVLAAIGASACESPPATLGARARAAATAAWSEIDRERLLAHVTALVAVRADDMPFTPAYYPLPHTNEHSSEYVASAFRALGLNPTIETEAANSFTTHNVYVDIRGTTHPDEIVIVSGHHDAWFAGADDNASAIAVVLEAARVLSGTPADRTIRFMAFDGEEYGLIGAQRYLARHGSEHVAMILNMDCVGYTSHAPNSQMGIPGLQAPTVGDFLVAAANAPAYSQLEQLVSLTRSATVFPTTLALAGPGDLQTAATVDFLRSDHAPFWRAGIPGIFFTDTASLRNPNYHKATDTPDTIDDEFLLGAARLITAATVAYATID